MPKNERVKTSYPGVYFVGGKASDGRPERIYYIIYRRDGKLIEEKVGRQYKNAMTPARASAIRTKRIEGAPSNQERRLEAKKVAWTLNRLWQEYIGPKPDSKGFRTDRYRYLKFLQAPLGSKEPKDITQIQVHRLRITLAKTLSAKTVKNILELLERVINFGTKQGLCAGLGFKPEHPRVNNQTTEDLTPEQLVKLLQAIDADHDLVSANLMKMALFTGMRRGELFKLRWQDVDFEKGFIHIIQPKGGQNQVVPMNSAAREILENHPKTESPYIFPGRNGGQRVEMRRPINRIRKRADLPPDFRPLHGLRHAYASLLASSGEVELHVIQRLLTHKTPQMTMRYSHLRDEALRRASDLASDLITQAQAVNGGNQLKVVKE